MEDRSNGDSNEVNVTPRWIPQLGMKFSTVDEAWKFWEYYGGRIGFNVRKRYTNTSKFDGKITSCRYVCSKEGHRVADKRDHLYKNPRAETRTDCEVRMSLTIDREVGNYEISDLVLAHNHILHLQEARHLIPSQRKISEVQAFEIAIADDSGIRPKAAHEMVSQRVGGSCNLSYTRRDHKNYLRTKRQRDLMYGEAGSMLKYFQDRAAENSSFRYAYQLDCEEHITNIFWADAKMIIDYAHFGDVMSFDTTFGTNKEYRPFGVFVGFNHFRETIIFGACLLYDETFDSFKWLFDTFLSIHNGKQPQSIFTDQHAAMGNAIEHVFLEVQHGLCTFHIMQNAAKHLCSHKDDDEEEESSILADFSACMYEYEDKETFEEAFDTMRGKVQKQTWFDSIYKVKEKWAECYMRNAFTLGMRSTQLSESLHNDLKHYLKSDLDIIRFMKQFERVVKGKRDNEISSEYEAREKLPKLKMKTPMLVQTSKLYTPVIFECFQIEYERSTAACTELLDGQYEYMVKIGSLCENPTFEEECKVIGNPSEQTAGCSCGQFERTGILCSHALKILDIMNIKLLPEHYILKRWTREARSGSVQDSHGKTIVEDPKLEAVHRYSFLSHKFSNLATRASNSEECCLLIENALDIVSKQVEERLNGCTYNSDERHDANRTSQVTNDMLTAARLKKKPIENKNSKRKKYWIEKFHKRRKKTPAKAGAPEKSSKLKGKENHISQNQDTAKEISMSNEKAFQEKGFMRSYTDLLMNSTLEDILSEDIY